MNVIVFIFIIISTVTALLVIPEIYAQDSQNNKDISFKNFFETDSSYLGYVQIQIRNSEGMLVGIVESDTILYRVHPWIDETLNLFPVVAIVERNGIQYEKIEIKNSIITKEDTSYPRTEIYAPKDRRIALFSANHHSFVVDEGYTYHIKWTIFRQI